MEALEIEGQTDQAPLTSDRLDTSQRELAEAEHLLDDAGHRFDGAFACAVDPFAQRRPELVGHFNLGAGTLRRRGSHRRESLLPSGMMGITARRDVRLHATMW